MLYYLAVLLKPDLNVLNVLTYHTVRAGGAAVTGFLISLLIGPPVIRWLQRLKIGQHIRKDHVADLHALHKGKAGTPTMGGSLIVFSTVLTLLLWGSLSNRLLIVALLVFCLLGAVGFLDDYIKLRRKHNRGLSARAKFLGQILVGLGLGVYATVYAITPPATHPAARDVQDWPALVEALKAHNNDARLRIWMAMPPNMRTLVESLPVNGDPELVVRNGILSGLKSALSQPDLYTAQAWPNAILSPEAVRLLGTVGQGADARALPRLNRLLLEAAFPDAILASSPHPHTDVGIPGLKNVLVPLGVFYILFIVLIIVGASNAVNLTDGLDGLAIGASLVSLLAYTGIAYVVSRADWSDYLFLVHVPEASELTVFGSALFGTGLGFLWFNAHPAEVFMGDTGSLALGGAIGTMAIMTKQELLLILVGGLFVLEASSVIIQVLSFKLRGKRVFKMAPLHHHFELLGWSETKVTVRFWILALIFALMSLSALKLR